MKAAWLLCLTPLVAQTLPEGFNDSLVATVPGPTALAFTPDGAMLITQQGGTLRVWRDGALLPEPALTIPPARICSNSERGLLGVAVDPQYVQNQFIYLYYTRRDEGQACGSRQLNGPFNRVSRFTMRPDNTVDPASETVLLDNILSYNGNHNGGDLQFGPDGLLYISVGDGGCDYGGSGCAGQNDAARDTHTLLGKILRIDRNGNIPSSNPWQGAGTARCNRGNAAPGTRCQETYVWGLRNPFRFAFDPNTNEPRMFINDVGQNAWEEIDVAVPGADYGWNEREGPCRTGTTNQCSPAVPPPAMMTDPVFAYPHSGPVPGTNVTGCTSITGGAFVPNGVWPREFDGAYLFSDYVCGTIFRLTLAPSTASRFAGSLGGSSAVHLAFGPHATTRALYYTTYQGGGQVRRIAYSGPSPNNPPVARISASPLRGSLPLDVVFNAAGTVDPDAGDMITYIWDFGDGTAPRTTTAPTINYTYTRAGVFNARLIARDQRNAESSATIQIVAGNRSPQVTIVAPGENQTFAVGETLSLRGSATDPDEPIPPSALSWMVVLHHNAHTHPLLGPVSGDSVTFQAPAPEDLEAASSSFLEIRFSATDAAGETTVTSRALRPRTVALTFNTEPAGLRLRINGADFTSPAAVTSWAGYVLSLSAPDQANYQFESWSDGAPRDRALTTPTGSASYTVRFRSAAGTTQVAVVSAASYTAAVAPASIASAFGVSLTGGSVFLQDAAGRELTPQVLHSSPGQINFIVPENAAPGAATLIVRKDGASQIGALHVNNVAPSIFTADQTGRGAPAAIWSRYEAGNVTSATVQVIDVTLPGEHWLSIYGTGIRGRSSLDAVEVRIGGTRVPVQFAGAHGQFVGLDQINVPLPRTFAGLGEVDLTVVVEGAAANVTRVTFR